MSNGEFVSKARRIGTRRANQRNGVQDPEPEFTHDKYDDDVEYEKQKEVTRRRVTPHARLRGGNASPQLAPMRAQDIPGILKSDFLLSPKFHAHGRRPRRCCFR
jgi:hypothetical protein